MITKEQSQYINLDKECNSISHTININLLSSPPQDSNTMIQKEKDLFNILHETRTKQSETFKDDDFKGFWTSITDKYPDSAHFIYELLQNADDANATQVSIILDKNFLVFKHNGSVVFTVSAKGEKPLGHINSITGIGASTKETDSANKIGKFGVGFKSVFQYTSRPEIYDDNFHFAIEDYIVPTLLDHDSQYREKGETLFYFPFKDSEKCYDEILDKLKNLENPILFLRHLQLVKWGLTNSEEIFVYNKEICNSFSSKNIQCELTHLSNLGQERYLWMFHQRINLQEKGTHLVSVGYYLNEKQNNLDLNCNSKIHCFFPTSESFKQCFIAHAPFLLVDSRQQIKQNEATNKLLVESIANLAADALPILRDISIKNKTFLLNDNILTIIKKSYESYESCYYSNNILDSAVFYESFTSIVKTENLILSRKNKYLYCKDAFTASPMSLLTLLSGKQLNELYNNNENSYDFISGSYNLKLNETLNSLVIKTLRSKLLAEKITDQFMSAQEHSWVIQFYNFLRTDALALWNKASNKQEVPFRFSPIILNTKNVWVPAYKNDKINIFYLNNSEIDNYNFVSKEYATDPQAKKFFDALGIKEPEHEDEINFIIQKYEVEHISMYEDEIIQDFESLFSYYKSIDSDKKEDYINNLTKTYYVIGLDSENNQFLVKIPDLYDNSSLIKEFSKNSENNIYIINYSYYSTIIEKHGKDSIKDFLFSIGLRQYPTIMEHSTCLPMLNERQLENLDLPSNRTALELSDYTLYGLESVSITKQISKDIWSWFTNIDINKYVTLTCVYKYYSWNERHCNSTFLEQLLSIKWLYNNKNELVSVKDITAKELEDEGYIKNLELCEILNIKKEQASLKELGATDEQNHIYNRGALFKTDEEATLALELLNEFNRNKKIKLKHHKTQYDNKSYAIENPPITGSPVNNIPLDKMFNDAYSEKGNNNSNISTFHNSDNVPSSDLEELENKQKEEKEREMLKAELKQQVINEPKYNFAWFKALLELEDSDSSSKINSLPNKSISIHFSTVSRIKDTEHTLYLKDCSQIIPYQIEDREDIEIVFSFIDHEDISCSFDSANIINNSLRVKAKRNEAESLNAINWERCTKATININNSLELTSKLKYAFKDLPFEDHDNLKENLKSNLSFVYGPPGTGKTTHIAKTISNLMDSDKNCKILVLAPTNKACDVIASKLINTNDDITWMGRFVATNDEEIEQEGYVCSRDSLIYQKTQCCIISTMVRLPYDGFSGEDNKLKDIDWDYIIIDEASMIPIAQIVFAIYYFNKKKIIVSGDPNQIAPIVSEDLWKDENIYSMVNLQKFDHPKTEPIQFDTKFLTTQYRSVNTIGKLFSAYAYDGKLNHHRENETKKKLSFGPFNFKSINYIPFKSSQFDSIYGAKKLSGSNVHIYSVLLSIEFINFIIKEFQEKNDKEDNLSIGIICPYKAQSQLIEKLLFQQISLPINVQVNVGTIHSFQGDECDIVLAVFNPPRGLKNCADKTLLNNKNIINVAISRARDYLFILLPHSESKYYENLKEINRLGNISTQFSDDVSTYTCNQIEQGIFKQQFYIEQNTFVTSHQLTNVYSMSDYKYEVRIDDKAVDIQINNI